MSTTWAAMALVLALTSCGGDPDGGSASGGDATNGMDMSALNEPDATPADRADGERTTGRFTVLDTAPPGSGGVEGKAWMAQNKHGTTITIRLSGLEPGTAYVSHLHEQSCADDNGGEHFRFDPAGGDTPPNEVHLGFTADQDGNGGATVTNDMRVRDAAPAIVVHPADAMDNRLACVDFS